jgi:hypothetical protein
VPLYLSLLADPKYKAKWIAMQAINRHGDDTCVDAVIDRFRKVVSKPSQSDGIDELTEGAEFLNRVAPNDPRVKKQFERIKNKWDDLTAQKQQFLRTNIPYFA